MKSKIIFILFTLISIHGFVLSQTASKHYLFSTEIRDSCQKDSSQNNLVEMAQKARFINRYKLSDSILKIKEFGDCSTNTNYPELGSIPDSQKVILVIDNVNTPNVCQSLTNILPELYKNGFRLLGLDGLSVDRILPDKNLILKDSLGSFLCNQNYYLLVKTALNLGFTCFSNQKGQTLDSLPSQKKVVFSSKLKNQEEIQNNFSVHPFTIKICDDNRSETETIKKAIDSLISDSSNIHSYIKVDLYLQQIKPEAKSSNFTMPKFRFIEFPAILQVYDTKSYDNGGLPFETREIVHQNDNTSFYLPIGEYTFLFLYRNRELQHALHVIITK